MINAKTFINELNKVGIEFYTGVPDSLMSEFSKSLHFDFDDKNHVIATNEDKFDLQFYKVDIDEHSDLANILAIRSVPTLIRFYEGEEIARTTGLQSLNNLIEFSKA